MREKYYTGEVLELDSQPTVSRPALAEGGELKMTSDIDLGDTYNYIDVNEPVIVERMLSEGLTSQQISSTPIHLSSHVQLSTDGRALYGNYSGESGIVTLYPATPVHALHNESRRQMLDYDIDELPLDGVDNFVSARMSTTLWHELRHVRQFYCDGLTQDEYDEQLKPARTKTTLGIIGLAATAGSTLYFSYPYLPGDDILKGVLAAGAGVLVGCIGGNILRRKEHKNYAIKYENHPQEQDARQAGDEAPGDIITAELKPHATVVSRPHGYVSRRDVINTAANLI